ncbi:MAG: insulinase family protein [Bacilli bacterium]|nr:insulinase family protein [Bacilli bacterium]
MDYIKKDLGSFNLHMINTEKFKTITIKILFHTPIIKEEITKRNVLADVLLQSSNKYNSKRDLIIAAEELYAADISTNNQRLGNYILTSFNLQTLMDKYTEEGNVEKSFRFLSEILFNPDIENKQFKKDKLDIAKNNSLMALDSIKENATNYSLIRMAETFDKDSPVSYRMTGYPEDLDMITEKTLYEAYQKMINNDYVDIFVVGNFDKKEMLALVKKCFKFKRVKKRKASYYLKEHKARKKRLFAKEEIDNTQSKLAIACPINKLTEYERNYPLILANLILGGGVDSKLFKDVREKNSLCYTVRSFSNKLDSLLVITAGIDKNNYSKTVEVITRILNDLKKGKFTDNDIEIAKEFYYTSIEELEEDEYRIIVEFMMEEILGLDPIVERLKKISKVNKKEIVKVFKKITMDTVFLLEGVKNEED